MSHLAYPNLARLPDFPERGLNYTGLPMEGWATPVLLAPLSLAIFAFLTAGLPRRGGWQAWWALLNTVIIHPMDFFVGALGVGPKYLVDEYAVLDTRYWVEKDNGIMWISYIELFAMVPLSYLWYRSAVRGHWSRYFWAILCSSFQQMGTFMYYGTELSDGLIHQPAVDWPPRFDTYLKVKYFWLVFICLNSIWIVVPCLVFWKTYKELGELVTNGDTKKLR